MSIRLSRVRAQPSEIEMQDPGLRNLSGRSQSQQYSPDLRLSNRLGLFCWRKVGRPSRYDAGRPPPNGRIRNELWVSAPNHSPNVVGRACWGLRWRENAVHASMSSGRRLIGVKRFRADQRMTKCDTVNSRSRHQSTGRPQRKRFRRGRPASR